MEASSVNSVEEPFLFFTHNGKGGGKVEEEATLSLSLSLALFQQEKAEKRKKEMIEAAMSLKDDTIDFYSKVLS